MPPTASAAAAGSPRKPASPTSFSFHLVLPLVAVILVLLYVVEIPWWALLVGTCAVLCVASWVWYTVKRAGAPGATWVVPFFGCIFELVAQPVKFWEKQRDYAPNGFSCNLLLGRLMVYLTSTQLAKQVFAHPDVFEIFVHPNAPWLLGSDNIIYKDIETHKTYRTLLHRGMFDATALSSYLPPLEDNIRSFIRERMSGDGFIDARLSLRVAAALSSQTTFCGNYFPSEAREMLAEDMLALTQGFLCLPLPLPFTQLGKAIAASKRLREYIAEAVEAGKKHVFSGGEPTCVVDYWCHEIMARDDVLRGKKDSGMETPNITAAVLDFLFASQDATVSALMWMLHHCSKDPSIYERVRAEIQEKVPAGSTIAKHFSDLTYLHSVTRELLRCYPPVPMLPHVTTREFKLTDNFTIPAGAVVIPSVIDAAQNEPHARRFKPEENPDPQFYRTLVFGGGQHMCAGRYYAMNVISMVLAILSTEYRVTRKDMPGNDTYMYLPTLFPSDNTYRFDAL